MTNTQLNAKQQAILESLDGLVASAASREVANGVSRVLNLAKTHGLMAAASGDDQGGVFGMLNAQGTGPKQAPAQTSVANVSNVNPQDSYQMQQLSDILTMESFIGGLIALAVYHDHPQPYDLTQTSEVMAFIGAWATWRNAILTGNKVNLIAQILPLSGATGSSMNFKSTSATFHADLLAQLFGAMSLPQAEVTELDGFLTQLANALKDLKITSTRQSQSLRHFLSYYYFDPVQGSDLKLLKVRMIYLQVDQSAWEAALSSKVSVSTFSFNSSVYTATATLNDGLAQQNYTNIFNSMQQLTGKDADTIKKLVNVKTIGGNA